MSIQARGVVARKGEVLYSEGDVVTSVWILKQGRVEMVRYSSGGHIHIMETIYTLQFFGAPFGGNPRTHQYSSNTAVAYVDSILLKIDYAKFLSLMRRSVPFVTSVCTLYSKRIGEMEDARSLSYERVSTRVAGSLLKLSNEGGRILRITRRELANLAGTSVETAIRTIRIFEKKNWMLSSRGAINLIDIPSLRTFVENGDNAAVERPVPNLI